MSGEDIRKLLGGYATGTLSEDERKALFEAALHDEMLFAALADEHALREMLDDPGNRAAVLRALEPKPRGWGLRWMVPVGIAAGLVVIASVIFVFQRPAPRGRVVEMAKVVQPALQPEVQLELPRSVPASAPAQRQAMNRAPAVTSRRDVREESKSILLSAPPLAGYAPAATPAPLSPALTPPAFTAPAFTSSAELRSAKKESLEIKSGSGNAAGGGTADSLVTVQAPLGIVNSPAKVQYTILKRGTDGQFKPVDVGSTFQPADVVRLNVETDEAGFLSVSQKEPPKMLFQGAVQKQAPVTIPATGSLDLSVRGALQILFSKQGSSGGFQNALLPASSLDKRKVAADAASKDQTPGVIRVDVKLNVATPAQQQK